MPTNNNVMTLNGPVQLKGGTAQAMSSANPLLAQREIAVESDTGKIKVGDGTHYWNDLPYVGGSASGGNINWPASDDNVYVIKNGAFVSSIIVNKPIEWSPSIDDSDTIYLSLDDDITPFQLTGTNTEVNSPSIDNSDNIVLSVDDDMNPYQLNGNNTEVNS